MDRSIKIAMMADEKYEDFVPENLFIHYTRILISVFGLVTCLSLFVFITSISIFLMTVNILQVDGSLGNANYLNR